MRTINKVILIGNVTRDPEMKQTASGQTICTFTIATNRVWTTGTGEKKSSSEYHDVVAWAGLAELAEKYVRKSKYIHVEGYLKTRSFDTPEGIKNFKTEIIINDMILLDKRQREASVSERSAEKIEKNTKEPLKIDNAVRDFQRFPKEKQKEVSEPRRDEIALPIEI